jgi:hypothetical protein
MAALWPFHTHFISIVEDPTVTVKCRTAIKVKEQLVLRKDMEVNEYKRQPNITLIHKLK